MTYQEKFSWQVGLQPEDENLGAVLMMGGVGNAIIDTLDWLAVEFGSPSLDENESVWNNTSALYVL